MALCAASEQKLKNNSAFFSIGSVVLELLCVL